MTEDKSTTLINHAIVKEFVNKNKPMTPELTKELITLCKAQSLNKLHLFQISGMHKFLFLSTRYQVYTCAVFFPIILLSYYKVKSNQWEQMKKKKKTVKKQKFYLGLATGFLLFTTACGIVWTLKMGKKTVQSIHYSVPDERIFLKMFDFIGRPLELQLNAADIQTLPPNIKKGDYLIQKTANININYINAKGNGEWLSRVIFESVISNGLKAKELNK